MKMWFESVLISCNLVVSGFNFVFLASWPIYLDKISHLTYYIVCR